MPPIDPQDEIDQQSKGVEVPGAVRPPWLSRKGFDA